MQFHRSVHFLLKPHWLFILSLSLTACGGGGSNKSTTNNSVAVSSSSFANSTSSINGTSSSVQTSSSIATTSSSSNTTTSSSIATTSSSIGSSSSSSSSVVVVVDNLAPTISLAASTTNITVATTLNLTATANDNVGVSKVEFYDGASLINSDASSPFSYSVALTSANNGTKTFTAKAYDAANNVASSNSISVTVNIDSTAPTVSLVSSSTNVTAAGNITLTATATDNVGVSKIEFYDGTTLLNTDTVSPFSYSVALTSANNGTKTYTVKAYDAANNVTTSNAISVTVNIVPTLSLVASTTNMLIAENLTLSATATNITGVTKVEFYDGTSLIATDTSSPYSYVIARTNLENGNKSYTAKAYDSSGNIITSTAVNVTVDIDSVFPTVSLTGSATNITAATTLNLTATAADNKAVTKVEFYDGSTLLNSDTTAPYTWAINISGAQSGTHYYVAKAYDASNNITNSNTVNVVVNIDDQAPLINISMAASTNISFVSPYVVNATTSDNVGVTKVDFFIGSNLASTDTTSPFSYTFTPTWEWNGNHVITAKAYDAKNNVAISNALNILVNIPTQDPIDETLVINGPKRVIANTLNTYYTSSQYAPTVTWDWQDQDPTALGFTVNKAWRRPTAAGYAAVSYGDPDDALHSAGLLSGIYVTGTPLAVGEAFSCALKVDGTIACWGDNFYGSLGNNSNVDSRVPVSVSGISGAKAVEAGAMFACAIKSDDTVACWGQNDNDSGARGMLGNNTTTNSSVPVSVTGLTGVVALAVGDNHSCAITGADNKVRCWGRNWYDVLGNPSPDVESFSSTPVEVTGFTDAVAVSAGSYNNCAIKRGGSVWCWGHGYWGQLGNGTNTVTQRSPVKVVGLENAISVSVGDRFACAVTADSKVWCWGYNLYGQLGNNSLDARNLPGEAQFTGIFATSVSAGKTSVCATTSIGLFCWGNSNLGVFNSLTPTPLNVNNPVFAAIGHEHGCALLKDGSIKCWGDNSSGGVGSGSTENVIQSPATVSGGTIFWK